MIRFACHAALVAALALPLAAVAAPGDFKVVRSFPTPTNSPDGLVSDGDFLWNSDCMVPKLFKISKATGQVVEEVDLSTVEGHTGDHSKMIMPDHIEVAPDGSLYINDHEGKSVIYKFDPVARHVHKTVALPYENNMGVAWDGQVLWNMEPFGNKIHALDFETGETKRLLPTPYDNSCGLAWDGQCLWVSDLTAKRLYMLDPASGKVEMSVDVGGPRTRLPTGIAFDKATGHVYYADEDPSNARIYELDVEYPASGPCARTAPAPAPGTKQTAEESGCATARAGLFLLLAPAVLALRRRRA